MRKLWVVLLLLPTLAGCLSTMDVGPGIDKISRGFSESMRWSDFSAAARYVHTDVRGDFLEQFTDDEDLRIVDSSYQRFDASQDGKVRSVYVLEYYRLPSGSVHKWRWSQEWELMEGKMTEGGVWLIKNKPPVLPWKK